METGNVVDDGGEDGGHGESIANGGYNVGDLDVELAVVVGHPATRDKTGVDTVKTNDVVGCEKTVEYKADHASDTVLGKHIKRVVDPEKKFHWKLFSGCFGTIKESQAYPLLRNCKSLQ